MKLDIKDWKILAELSKDCRIPSTQLAKVVGVSREVADYRIKRLTEQGVIKAFCADISLEALGYTKHVVYLELKNVQTQKEEEIFRKLSQNKYISWLVTSTGKWSVIFDLHSRDTKHLGDLIRELKNSLGNNIGAYELVTLEKYHYFHSKYFKEKQMPRTRNSFKPELDAIDRTILHLLRNNARIDYVELSKHIDLTPEAISKRIKQLRKNGIIRQCYIFPDLTKLGFEHYNIQMNLEHIDYEKERSILHYFESHPSVSFTYKPISHWDLEIGVFVKNPGELREFMRQLRALFHENIRIKDTILFYDELIPNFLPEGVFE